MVRILAGLDCCFTIGEPDQLRAHSLSGGSPGRVDHVTHQCSSFIGRRFRRRIA
jgi:hypothetical protein